ncbi:hypothetical protein [Mariniblastus fucicola]|uniref:hypothetical protein n=1 Tax=Mariniblastus fucicola TaxID=980251 RepID=UPI0009468201|nr:hypothetical protein [Mariniblastus fucicola]
MTLISGVDGDSVANASRACACAYEIEECEEIHLVKRKGIDRLIAIFDSRFASRANGETTILPITSQVNAQQTIAFYERKDSELTIDDLVAISKFLPWNESKFPQGVSEYRAFDDPIELSTFGSKIADQPSILSFTKTIQDGIGTVRYMAGTTLKEKGKTHVSSLLVLGFENNVDIQAISFDELELPTPARHMISGNALLILFNPNRDDGATKHLNDWLDQLEQIKAGHE